MDFIEGLPPADGKEVIMVVVDRLSKYAHFVSLPHPFSAATVAQAYMDNIFKLHGMPSTIISDRDPIFTSNFWQEFWSLQGIQLKLSTAYHPQTDGQTEVVNRSLETYLRCMCADEPKRWNKLLALAEYWFNTNYHTATHSSPFELLYGYPPPLHIPYFPKDNRVPAVDKTLLEREMMLSLLKFHLQRAQDRMRNMANKHRTERRFEAGDWVYIKLQMYRQKSLGDSATHKLNYLYYGPYRISDRIGEVAYKLELPPGSKIHPTFHISQLKRKVGPLAQGGTQIHSQFLFSPSTEDVPDKLIHREMVKRNNKADVRMLISWKGRNPDESSWLYWSDLKSHFPGISINEKGDFVILNIDSTSTTSLRQG